MGWSVFGKIAQGLTSLIPGVGPMLSAGIGAATDVAGGVIGSKANKNATNAQLQAIRQGQEQIRAGTADAAQTLRGGQAQAYDAQQGALEAVRRNNQPYQDVGGRALYGLGEMLDQGQLKQQEFDPNSVQMDPGFQSLVDDAIKALGRSAAGRGRINSGGTTKEIIDYAQMLKNKYYGEAFNRQLSAYQANRQAAQDTYSRYLGLSEMGRSQTSQTNAAETGFGQDIANLDQQTGRDIAGNQMRAGELTSGLTTSGGAVKASGYVQGANILNRTIGNVGQDIGNMISLRQARQPDDEIDVTQRKLVGNY